MAKVFESLVFDQVSVFLLDHFSPFQFSFLPQRSTLQQLLVFLSDVFANLNNKIDTNVVYLDFAKHLIQIKRCGLWVSLVIFGCGLNHILIQENRWFPSIMVSYLTIPTCYSRCPSKEYSRSFAVSGFHQ